MADALPALEAAKSAVDCIEKKHIGEMKALGSPPDAVKTAIKAVLILLNEKVQVSDPDDKVWKKGVLVMGNPAQFL